MAFKFVLLAAACSVSLAAPQLGGGDRSFLANFPNGRGFLTPAQAARAQTNGQQARQGFLDLDLTLNEHAETTTPVPILRFVDRQNPDGSYTYGFENGDGTYKIETRYETGEVKGKYGYIDPTGELREVEYGATPTRGFEPTIDGLVVAPPTLVDETVTEAPAAPAQPAAKPSRGNGFVTLDQVRESPRTFANFAPRDGSSSSNRNAARRVVVRKRPSLKRVSAPEQVARPAARPVQVAAPVQQLQPVQPLAIDAHRFSGHPAKNINLNTGSYTFEYGKK